jgi:prenyltransferase beta subunit
MMRLEHKMTSSLLSEKLDHLCQEWIRQYHEYRGANEPAPHGESHAAVA